MTNKVIWPKVILFGSSTTQFGFGEGNWAGRLAHRLQRRCDVINRGFSGYTTRMGRQVLPNIVDKEHAKDVAAFVIFLGSNDSAHVSGVTVPLAEYRDNLKFIVRYLEDLGISREKVILIGAQPCVEELYNATSSVHFCVKSVTGDRFDTGMECKDLKPVADWAPNVIPGAAFKRTNGNQELYCRTCGEVARELGVDFVDLYLAIVSQKNWEHCYVSDGIHFNSRGGATVFNALWPLVQKRVECLPVLMPPYRELITWSTKSKM